MTICEDIQICHVDQLREVFADPDIRRQFSAAPLASGKFERYLFSVHDKFVITKDGVIVGVGVISRSGDRGGFGYAVLPEFRGRGLAKECLAAIESRAVASGIRTLTTNIAADNQRSIRAAASSGFRPFRILEKNLGK